MHTGYTLTTMENLKYQLVTSTRLNNYLTALNPAGICDHDKFKSLVGFRDVDMNNIPDDLRDFDFTRSPCSVGFCKTLLDR